MANFKDRLQKTAAERPYVDPDLKKKKVEEKKQPMPEPKVVIKEVEVHKPSEDTKLILEAFKKLCEKIDELKAVPPVVNIPAPVIEMVMPEMQRVITKTVERDEDGRIANVTESIVEKPTGRIDE